MKKSYEEYYKEIVNDNGEYYNKINTNFTTIKIKKKREKLLLTRYLKLLIHNLFRNMQKLQSPRVTNTLR